MRLEFEPNVTAFPFVENEFFDDPVSPIGHDFAVLLKKGISAAQNGERELAREMLLQASELDPRSEDAWMWLASVSDYPEELLAFLHRVLEINPANERAAQWRSTTKSLLAKTFVQRAVAAREEGSVERARQCLDQALVFDYNCEMAWFWKASIATSDDQKLTCLNHVLEINPDNDDARVAVKAIQKARSQDGFYEARTAAVAGKRKKALELVDEFLRSVPDNSEAWVLRSHLALGMDEKIKSLEKALAIDPQNEAAKTTHAFLLKTVASAKERTVAKRREIVLEPVFAPVEETRREEPAVECNSQSSSPEWFVAAMASQPDADRVTLERLPDFDEDLDEGEVLNLDHRSESVAESSVDFSEIENVGESCTDEASMIETLEFPVGLPAAAPQTSGFDCPYCSEVNEVQAFECVLCHATLTLSDIESLLSNPRSEHEKIQQAVTQMEAEWNLREFSEDELTALGIGHFNLNNFESGLKYLREASRLNPNNVILAGQVNTLAIRLDERRRQDENHDAMAKGKTILVVDDSPTVRKLIAGKLEKSGHTVVCAVDGVEAMERIRGNLPDLVLLDIAMPRMDGYEVCKEIRSNRAAADLPIVMISGKDGFFDKVRGRLAGATGYVTKPFGPETLMKALDTYLLPENE